MNLKTIYNSLKSVTKKKSTRENMNTQRAMVTNDYDLFMQKCHLIVVYLLKNRKYLIICTYIFIYTHLAHLSNKVS